MLKKIKKICNDLNIDFFDLYEVFLVYKYSKPIYPLLKIENEKLFFWDIHFIVIKNIRYYFNVFINFTDKDIKINIDYPTSYLWSKKFNSDCELFLFSPISELKNEIIK